jgi:hypothetical protein
MTAFLIVTAWKLQILHSINRIVCVAEKQCVSCEVWTGFYILEDGIPNSRRSGNLKYVLHTYIFAFTWGNGDIYSFGPLLIPFLNHSTNLEDCPWSQHRDSAHQSDLKLCGAMSKAISSFVNVIGYLTESNNVSVLLKPSVSTDGMNLFLAMILWIL